MTESVILDYIYIMNAKTRNFKIILHIRFDWLGCTGTTLLMWSPMASWYVSFSYYSLGQNHPLNNCIEDFEPWKLPFWIASPNMLHWALMFHIFTHCRPKPIIYTLHTIKVLDLPRDFLHQPELSCHLLIILLVWKHIMAMDTNALNNWPLNTFSMIPSSMTSTQIAQIEKKKVVLSLLGINLIKQWTS